MYVLNEYNKIFLKQLLYKFVVHIFTLLLAPFAFKLINYLLSCNKLILSVLYSF